MDKKLKIKGPRVEKSTAKKKDDGYSRDLTDRWSKKKKWRTQVKIKLGKKRNQGQL